MFSLFWEAIFVWLGVECPNEAAFALEPPRGQIRCWLFLCSWTKIVPPTLRELS